jgi:hypothetical protein
VGYKQTYNDELVQQLTPDFQGRYEPNFAWKSACSQYLALPALRGSWPFSSFDQTGVAYDLSGQGRTLTAVGPPEYNYHNLAPYVDFDGANDYLSRADEAGLDITGLETVVAAGARGLTIGGWFWTDTLAYGGTTRGFIGKYLTAGNQRSYMLAFDDVLNSPRFIVSVDGTATVSVLGMTMATNAWYCIIGRFIPSTELKIWVNGETATNAVGIPAQIFPSAADLNVGAYNNGAAANRLDGRASMCFLCAAALSDAIVGQIYQQSRAMFGV